MTASQDGDHARFPLADGPSILQAAQKDQQIEELLLEKLKRAINAVKGQWFVNVYAKEISIAAKLLYLSLTTLRGVRTLGEEYADLMYIDRSGKKLVPKYKKLLYILGYALGPYTISKLLHKLQKNTVEEDNKSSLYDTYIIVLNHVTNLNLLLFYFKGAYYHLCNRIFGLKYVVAHPLSPQEAHSKKTSTQSFKILGYILALQDLSKTIPIVFKSLHLFTKPKTELHDPMNKITTITGMPKESAYDHINLEDPKQLPFIKGNSRRCGLCLSDMLDPSCSPCGHIFCWHCLTTWCKDKSECPLCRQACKLQQVLPIL